jgi:hypothetical protein
MFKQKCPRATKEAIQKNDGRTNIMLEKLKQKLEKTAEDLDDIILDIS